MRKELAGQLLREFLKNSKRSDRELAKVLGVSQPTITRARRKLELEGLIENYTIVPDFRKMGFEILAINLAKLRSEVLLSEMSEKVREFAARFPNVIFASAGRGMGMNAVSIILYRNYREYHNSINLMKTEWKDIIEDIQSFIVAIGEGEFKRLSTAHLKNLPL